MFFLIPKNTAILGTNLLISRGPGIVVSDNVFSQCLKHPMMPKTCPKQFWEIHNWFCVCKLWGQNIIFPAFSGTDEFNKNFLPSPTPKWNEMNWVTPNRNKKCVCYCNKAYSLLALQYEMWNQRKLYKKNQLEAPYTWPTV